MARELVEFVKAAIRNPIEVSTVFPTSRSLATTLLNMGSIESAGRVVELGAGTGAITKYLAPRLQDKDAYFGIELDPNMVAFLKTEFPELHFETGLAENIPQWVAAGSVDLVVSSLPWTVFNDETQERTIQAIHKSLKPGGSFVTYVCANALWYPQAKALLRRLHTTFASVERSELEWRNIPPAYVFKSTK